jgi:hypothetical protein
MGKRKVTILEPAIEEVARVTLYVVGEGLRTTANRFIAEAFAFLNLSLMTVLSIALVSILHGKN